MREKVIPGINVQFPWARKILNKSKCVETRTYPLPTKFLDQEMWLIETPGPQGKFRARVIGIIKFCGCKEYLSASDFYSDFSNHGISKECTDYKWKDGSKKFGWIISEVVNVPEFEPPHPRGIVYSRPFSNFIDCD